MPVRVGVIGTGTVGKWLLRAIRRDRERIGARYGVDLRLVAVGGRDGLIHDPAGIDVEAVLATRARGEAITAAGGVWHTGTALAGVERCEADILVEVGQSPASDGEPGRSHMRCALDRGIAVATSNKWPVALAGVELAALAERRGVGFRAESTVMSGTPVLAALTDGLGGATPIRLRGIVNATVNAIVSWMEQGLSYAQALAEAQEAGLAERDPGADVDGLDAVAKVMVLSALLFGEQLARDDVSCRGISALDEAAARAAFARGERIREVATLDPGSGRRSVEVMALPASDPLYGVEGTDNCVRLEADPLGAVAVIGPGAGPALAGQGVFSDVIALARRRVGRAV